MVATKDIAKRLAAFAAIAIAMGFMLVMLAPARLAYALVGETADLDCQSYSEDDLSSRLEEDVQLPVTHFQRPSRLGLSEIGEAEHIIVETEIAPEDMECGAYDSTPEAQIALAVIAAFIPLTHFAKVALIDAYKRWRETRRKPVRTAQPVRMPARTQVAYQQAHPQVAYAQVRRNAPAPARLQVAYQQVRPQSATVFDCQPRQQVSRPAPQRRQPVRVPQTYQGKVPAYQGKVPAYACQRTARPLRTPLRMAGRGAPRVA